MHLSPRNHRLTTTLLLLAGLTYFSSSVAIAGKSLPFSSAYLNDIEESKVQNFQTEAQARRAQAMSQIVNHEVELTHSQIGDAVAAVLSMVKEFGLMGECVSEDTIKKFGRTTLEISQETS